MTDLKPAQVADELGVHLETVKRLLRSGELQGFRVGRLWRITPEALANYRNKPGVSSHHSPIGPDGKRSAGHAHINTSSLKGEN